jgi:diguanylate cyclase (GGDEF)-like protein/PAS domain S-box-containing protein
MPRFSSFMGPSLRRLYLPSLLLFAVCALLVHFAVSTERSRQQLKLRSHVSETLLGQVARIETELNANVFLANGLVAFVTAMREPTDKEIQAALKTLFQFGRHLKNIGVAPGNRLTHIYPLKGNEGALGLYYPDQVLQWPAVQQAIERRTTVLAGPVQLKQGGVGLISRTPVFYEDGRYWGVLSLVLDRDSLFKAVQLQPESEGLSFALRGKDGLGAGGAVFFGDATIFDRDAVTFSIQVPGGSWEISARPVAGWQSGQGYLWGLQILGLVLSALAAVILYFYQQGRLRIEASEKRFRAFLDTTRDGVVVIDDRGMILEFNAGAEKLFGYAGVEVLGTSLNQLMPKGDAAVHDQYVAHPHGSQARIMSPTRAVKGRRKDGSEVQIEVTVGEARIAGAQLHVGVIRDITERLAFEHQLTELATRDSLTGALNRRAFTEQMDNALQLARRHGHALSLLLMDADHFKKINDSYGHQTGDRVLVSLTALAQTCLRTTDRFGRWGGEEFVVLLPETDATQAVEVAERLLAAVRCATWLSDTGVELPIRVSIGLATLGSEVPDAEKLIQRADEALYRAKAEGRNGWRQ